MPITDAILKQAVQHGIIDQYQADQLVDLARSETSLTPQFSPSHMLYYLGGFIAIGAMTIFMNLGWERFGGWGMLAIALVYSVIGLLITQHLSAKGLNIPAGISATFVVCLTPIAVYGLQHGMGWWPLNSENDTSYRDFHRLIEWHWLYLELATLFSGCIMLWRYRFPFLVMPLAATLWYMSMDVGAMLSPVDAGFLVRSKISLIFGLAMIALGIWVDYRSQPQQDYPFWLYLFGVVTFWGGLHMLNNETEWFGLVIFLCSLLLIAIGALLVRKVFVVFGALGVLKYLSYLSGYLFQDSWLYPVTLTFVGAGIVWLGIYWQRNEIEITAKLYGLFPAKVQRFLRREI